MRALARFAAMIVAALIPTVASAQSDAVGRTSASDSEFITRTNPWTAPVMPSSFLSIAANVSAAAPVACYLVVAICSRTPFACCSAACASTAP